jgi:hypothetical protein
VTTQSGDDAGTALPAPQQSLPDWEIGLGVFISGALPLGRHRQLARAGSAQFVVRANCKGAITKLPAPCSEVARSPRGARSDAGVVAENVPSYWQVAMPAPPSLISPVPVQLVPKLSSAVVPMHSDGEIVGSHSWKVPL